MGLFFNKPRPLYLNFKISYVYNMCANLHITQSRPALKTKFIDCFPRFSPHSNNKNHIMYVDFKFKKKKKMSAV